MPAPADNVRINPVRSVATFLTLVNLWLLLPGCHQEGQAPDKLVTAPTAAPIVVLGLDGLEWDVLIPMLASGRLPHFGRLMERGYYGELRTMIPTYSPVVWTTIATGKRPQKHGILHFARSRADGSLTLYTNRNRTTKAIWNILSDYGKRVSTIGWWMTYPVEPINGVMVAQTNTAAQLDTRAGRHIWKGTLLKGILNQVYPRERQNEMITVLEEVDHELPELTKKVFGDFPHPLTRLDERLWNNCQWAFRADATYVRIAGLLAREHPHPDLTLIYLGGPDVVGHRFWRYMKPGLYKHRPTEDQIANFASIIEDYYAYTDRVLGKLLDAYGPEVTILVVSDHGMKPVNRIARFDPDNPPADINSAEHQNAPHGVFLAAGRYVRTLHPDKPVETLARSDLSVVGSVLDITPTLLAMLRIPLGQDMDGRVLNKVFRKGFVVERQPAPVASHDTPEFLATRVRGAVHHPGEQERLQQLRTLGYIGDMPASDRRREGG